jgi:hypothetical protein
VRRGLPFLRWIFLAAAIVHAAHGATAESEPEDRLTVPRGWSAGRGVLVGVEQVGKLLLDRGCVGEHALGSGAAFGAVVGSERAARRHRERTDPARCARGGAGSPTTHRQVSGLRLPRCRASGDRLTVPLAPVQIASTARRRSAGQPVSACCRPGISLRPRVTKSHRLIAH